MKRKNDFDYLTDSLAEEIRKSLGEGDQVEKFIHLVDREGAFFVRVNRTNLGVDDESISVQIKRCNKVLAAAKELKDSIRSLSFEAGFKIKWELKSRYGYQFDNDANFPAEIKFGSFLDQLIHSAEQTIAFLETKKPGKGRPTNVYMNGYVEQLVSFYIDAFGSLPTWTKGAKRNDFHRAVRSLVHYARMTGADEVEYCIRKALSKFS